MRRCRDPDIPRRHVFGWVRGKCIEELERRLKRARTFLGGHAVLLGGLDKAVDRERVFSESDERESPKLPESQIEIECRNVAAGCLPKNRLFRGKYASGD